MTDQASEQASEKELNEQNNEQEAPDFGNMTDEEILALDPATLNDPEENASTEENQESGSTKEDDQSAGADEKGESDSDAAGGAGSEESTSDSDDEAAGKTSDEESSDHGDDDKSEEAQRLAAEADQASESDNAESSDKDSTDKRDYKSELAEVMKPFKAANREITVKTAEDVRRLMQMGVDYSRKMADMKPYQRVLKTLEKHDLLDMNEINFVIDLVKKKDPEALKKFLRDNEIDPMDLSLKDGTDWKPNDYSVGDKEIMLDEVLTDISDTSTFDATVNVISKQWDMASRRQLMDNPGIIAVINEHMESGVYKQIADRMLTEKTLGRLAGLSDLEAYKAVGEAIETEKGWINPPSGTNLNTDSNSQDSAQNQSAEAAKAEKRRKDQKRAASPTKGKAGAGKKAPDFAKMTDEEIEAFDASSL